MLLNCDVGEDSWESLGLQGDPTSPSWRRSVLGVHWKDWCWSWNSNTLATWSKELTHLKRPWCWERLRAEEGDSRGWEGWMASPTQWTWVWVDSGSWWWAGRPGMLWFMGSQRVRHDWVTELNWTDVAIISIYNGYKIPIIIGASLVAQTVKSLPAVQETQVQSLGGEDPLEEDMATHSSILAWKIPWMEEPGGLQFMGSKELDMTEWLHFQISIIIQRFVVWGCD